MSILVLLNPQLRQICCSTSCDIDFQARLDYKKGGMRWTA